jgi:hypothetical protein
MVQRFVPFGGVLGVLEYIKRKGPTIGRPSLKQDALIPKVIVASTPIGKVRLMGIVGLGRAKVLRYGRPQDLAHPYLIGKTFFFKGIGLTLG